MFGCKQEKPVNKRELESGIINGTSETIEIKQKELSKNPKITKNMILGIWTNGSTENATFEIKPKTIYYVDDFKDYKYSLKNDTIEINYPDYVYRAGISLRNDTLIMNSKEYSQAKYWKFKG